MGKELKKKEQKKTFITRPSNTISAASSFKWEKKALIVSCLPLLPAGDQTWQENESSDSMSALILLCCCTFMIGENILKKGPSWGKIIQFASQIDEASYFITHPHLAWSKLIWKQKHMISLNKNKSLKTCTCRMPNGF